MSFSVTMPALGESVSEGTVTRWLKAEGDHVAVDEPLLEVSTDKVDTEIPSPVAGILQKIVVGVDVTVAVGAELAVIAGQGCHQKGPLQCGINDLPNQIIAGAAQLHVGHAHALQFRYVFQVDLRMYCLLSLLQPIWIFYEPTL